jgi:type II secretory pathway component GspD/PulD (secretin)
MKSLMRVTVAFVCVIWMAMAIGQVLRPFRVNFSKTNVDEVLLALSQQTGANIIYNGKGDIPITVNFVANSTEEAVRGASAAAGLAYKRIGGMFVVAAPENLRQAVKPFGNRVRFTLTHLKPDELAKMIEATYPTVSAEAAGDKLAVTAVMSEIGMVREFIEEKEEQAAKNQQTRVIIPTKFASAATVATTIKNLYPSLLVESVAKTGGETGSIVISGPKTDVDSAARMVASLDSGSPSSSEDEDIQVYDIRYSSAPELLKVMKDLATEVLVIAGPANYAPRKSEFSPLSGLKIGGTGSGSGSSSSSTSGVGTGSESTTGTDDESNRYREGDNSKTLIVRGRRSAVASALTLLRTIDVKPRQVMVEVQVIDTSPEFSEKLGVKWDWLPFNFFETPRGTNVGGSFLNTTKPAGIGQFTRLPMNFNAILDAMVVNKEAKILAKPSVMVIDGQDSNVFIGDTIRARLAQAGSLGAQTVEIAEFPVGIILLFRPRINADGNITMRVHPVVSTITALDSDNIPQTSTREAETTVMVKDGETVVIGGLIREEMTRTIQEIPLLSKLPLIGELFKSRSTNKRKSEIMVLITPRLVKDTDAKGGN